MFRAAAAPTPALRALCKAAASAAFQKLIAKFIDFYARDLFNPHWGEQIAVAPDNTLKISMVCQGLDNEQTKQIWAPFFEWVRGSPREFTIADELGAGVTGARHWW